MSNNEQKIADALLKKAIGYSVEEVVSEYINDENAGGEKLVKKKITTKHIPPDSMATKTLIALFYGNKTGELSKLSDAELLSEKNRIIAELEFLNQKGEEDE
ncbi:MAG: hypothetical protein FWE53_02925 [Firmicutes bacterium]|nr:hypothetical protein [Bacillota bacterium]